MTKRRRPYKVFVCDIGPSYSFASPEAAAKRAVELVERERYGRVLTWNVDDAVGTFERTIYSPNREPRRERLNQTAWVWEAV